jgi:tetratricopeptide (TPR) repeat protein
MNRHNRSVKPGERPQGVLARMSILLLLIVLVSLITGCVLKAGPKTDPPMPSGQAATQSGQQTPAADSDTPADPTSDQTEHTRPRISRSGVWHLDMWNDPAFQRRFVESYIAETEIEPRVTIEERESMQKVLSLIQDDKMDEALKLVEQGRGEAASAVFDFTYANIHFQRENYNQAAAAYKVAVKKYPKFRRAWKNLALIHIRQGDFQQAVPALTRVIELGGGDSLTYGLLGYAYSSQENSISAESAYRLAILLDPKTMDWKMGLARSYFRQGRFADAATLCGQLLDKHPDRTDLWMLQANAYIGLDRPMDAAENLELVGRMGKATAESLNMLGDIYINEELFDLAVDCYIDAMEEKPDQRPDRAIRAAKVLTARAAYDQTQKLIKAIEHSHGDMLSTEARKDLLKLRARIAVAEGSGEEEAEVLKEIVELDPLDGEALILLGQHASRSGDIEQAIFYYERAASLEQFEADAKVRHAQLLVGQGKYEQALPLLRRAQVVKPRENVQEYLEQVERVARSR